MNLRQLPNTISVFRILLVFPIIYLLLQQQYQQALVLFLIAGVSDGVDGFLAKHYGWQTWLGGVLDPLADKFLLVSCFHQLRCIIKTAINFLRQTEEAYYSKNLIFVRCPVG